MKTAWAISLVLVLVAGLARPLHAADATLSLPLQGHYRIGRYMPVRVSAQTDSPGERFTLEATGALKTEISAANGRIDGLVPWLCIHAIHNVKWSTPAGVHPIDMPLQALNEDYRLIGYAGADPDALAPLFAGKNLIRVGLDITDPLPGNATAWEALDGLVLDAAAARRPNTEGLVRTLLAGGTVIAIKSVQKPGGGWAWQRHGPYWIARADIAGPTSAFVPEAYQPTETWIRGWPWSVRRETILVGVVVLILATAATLWRSRWATAIVVFICLAATTGIFVWRHRQSPVIEVSGSVIILAQGTTQRDQWTYRAVLRESSDHFAWQPLTRPVFAYRNPPHELDTGVSQLCGADGTPMEFRYRLKPDQSLAFQTRFLQSSRDNVLSSSQVTSSLRDMADHLYALKDDRIVAQIDNPIESHWPDVVIDRPAASADRP